MGEPNHVLLCTWHVDKNFRKNLNKINGSTELKSQVYKFVRTLLQETDLETFEKLLPKVKEQLLNDDRTKPYGKYLEKEYFWRKKKWAYA